MLAGVLDGAQPGNFCLQLLQHFRGAVLAAVVHHHNFVRHLVQREFQMKMFDGGRQRFRLIPRQDYHAEQFQRFGGRL